MGLSSGSGLPLFEHSDVEIAVDFLQRARQAQGDISIPQSALIIGGGDVAMDVASTLKVLGCQAVTCVAREELDEFAASSQQKCEAAIAAGGFDAEIVPVQTGVDRKTKEPIIFSKDEGPRAGTTAESLSKLKCCSGKEGGVVTAGNASGINDGAAAIVVMSEEKAKELGVTPMATFVGGALGGVDPAIMGVGPVASTNKLLKKTGLTIDDMDIIEANEAFAAQSVAVAKDLKFDMSKVNKKGGAIALGHPVGASGARILVTLLHEMQKRDAKKGLATLCIGGGMGTALVVERE